MESPINKISTFGDSRRMMLDAAAAVLSGELEVSRATAFASIMKEVNGSILAEVSQAKAVIACQQAGHDFGRVVGMGQRAIAGQADRQT